MNVLLIYQKEVIKMMATIKDAIVFLSKDSDPIVGAVSYEKPLTANTPLTIKTNNHASTTILTKQAKMLVCKLTNNAFGFIVNSHTYLVTDNKDFNYLNESTKQMLRRELKACFIDERQARHELIQENA